MRETWACLGKKAVEWERLMGWIHQWSPVQKDMIKGKIKSQKERPCVLPSPTVTQTPWTATICMPVALPTQQQWPKPPSSLPHITVIASFFPFLLHVRIISTQQSDWVLKCKAHPASLLILHHENTRGPQPPWYICCSISFLKHIVF